LKRGQILFLRKLLEGGGEHERIENFLKKRRKRALGFMREKDENDSIDTRDAHKKGKEKEMSSPHQSMS